MFLLKLLFILLLIAFIVLLAYTIMQKIKNPEKSIINCLPFMDDFSSNNAAEKAQDISQSTAANSSDNVALNTSNKVKAQSSSPSTTIETTAATDTKKTVKKSATSAKKTTAVKPKTTKKKKASKAKKAKGDNIKKINGIGPVFEKKLNAIGVNTFAHIAAWSEADVERMDEELELSGRPQREEWVRKAKTLAAEKNA